MISVTVIVSTYRNPERLALCLESLQLQSYTNFEVLIADDGSGDRTREVIDRYRAHGRLRISHVWQADRGFRKTRILNKALASTATEYLVFVDGDCLAHPDFIGEHVKTAKPGCYVNGSLIRLNRLLTDHLLATGQVNQSNFNSRYLWRRGRRFDRRFLRLSLPYGMRRWLDRHSRTTLYWLGSNSSCFRQDAIAINGFDNRFTYGFEDGDFGKRLENFGVAALTARWTAVLLHLDHSKPWADPKEMERNRQMMTILEPGGRYWADDGLDQVYPDGEYRAIVPSES